MREVRQAARLENTEDLPARAQKMFKHHPIEGAPLSPTATDWGCHFCKGTNPSDLHTCRNCGAPIPAKFARFKQVANEDPGALSEALVQLAEAFDSMAESAEALVENLDLAPVPKEATIKEKIAARKKFAANLKKLAEESPEKVEEAINEIYNAVDEVAQAIENFAQNLGFELGEIQEEPVLDEGIADESEVIEESSLPPTI